MTSAFSWQNSVSLALLHFVLQGQICLLLQVFLEFLLLHSRMFVTISICLKIFFNFLAWVECLFPSLHFQSVCILFFFFGSILLFIYLFFILYNIVLVLPYINMHLPQVYTEHLVSSTKIGFVSYPFSHLSFDWSIQPTYTIQQVLIGI